MATILRDRAEGTRIFLVGMMGCGKTTVGKRLAEALKLDFVDLDDAIVKRTKISVTEFFSKHGEFEFRTCEAQVLRDIPRRYPNAVVATGGGTPLQFDNMSFINDNGLSIFLDIDSVHLIERLAKQRDARPLLNRDDWETFLDTLTAQRRPTYEQADVTVEVVGGDSTLATAAIVEQLPQIVGH